jgi:hypothetical protein
MNIKNFKKGMKIKISTDVTKTDNLWAVVGNMHQMIGKSAIISEVDYNNNIVIINGYKWHPDDIILFIPNNKIIKISDNRTFDFNIDLL